MKRRMKKKKRQSSFSAILVAGVVVFLMLIVSVKCVGLRQKQDAFAARKQELQEQIDKEEARAEELEDLRKYVQTDSFVQEVAEERLRLVREDEILFKTTK